jgi:hypothetical protein
MFSKDINMKLGLEKCKTQSIQRGKMVISEYKMEYEEIIIGMQEKDTYRYLGIKPARLGAEKEQKED